MNLQSTILAATTFALVGPALHAQSSTRVVPNSFAKSEANWVTRDPFISTTAGYRYQQVIAAKPLARATVNLKGVSFRVWSIIQTTYPAQKLAGVTIKVGRAKTTPDTMSLDFAANRLGVQTTVFQGTISLPAYTTIANGPQAFTNSIAFQRPYRHAVAAGSFLLEMSVAPSSAKALDRLINTEILFPSAGSAQSFGKQGRFRSGETVTPDLDWEAMYPGGSVDLSATGLKSAYPTLASFGFSKSSFGALPLPFDLGPLGAPGNTLYASIDLIFGATVSKDPSGHKAEASFRIPEIASLGGAKLYAQLHFLDPGSNALGLVTSSALDMTLGSLPTNLESLAIRAESLAATRGSFLVRSSDGTPFRSVPITQLLGDFQ